MKLDEAMNFKDYEVAPDRLSGAVQNGGMTYVYAEYFWRKFI